MTDSVKAVEKINPKMMPFVIGAQSAPPNSDSVNNPPMVVSVVSMIGHIRTLPAVATAARSACPLATLDSIKSTGTMALLMTIPPSVSTPSMAIKPRPLPVTN